MSTSTISAGSSSSIEKRQTIPQDQPPESIWGQGVAERYLFVFIVGCAGQASAFALPTYMPTIPVLATYFDKSIESINLTATIYSIFQGVSPLCWASLSDHFGRRPTFIACLAITVVANCLLASTNSYGGLFGLKVLQSFGSAPTTSLLAAICGDFTTRENRGGIVALASSLQIVGMAVGPLFGGAILQRWDWRAVSWFLAAHAGLFLLLFYVFIPETNRRLCGNGSILPSSWIYWSPWAWYRRLREGVPYTKKDPEYTRQRLPPKTNISLFVWLYLLKQPDVLLVLMPNAIIYTTWYMVLTSMAAQLENTVHLNLLDVGLCYLPAGVGAIIATMLAGKAMNWNYQRRNRQLKEKCQRDGREYDPEMLNIYKVRLELAAGFCVLAVAFTLIFGWTFYAQTHYLVPVFMTLPISMSANFFISTSTVVLVDLFPEDSAASTSCVNLTRCLLCAAGLAALDGMTRTMNIGGCFTLMAGLCGLGWVCIWADVKYGPKFAAKRVKN